MKKLLLFIFVLSTFSFSQNRIDVLNIKNGDIIKGKIIENKINDYIRIELQGGSILTYKYAEIEEIGFEEVAKKVSNNSSSSVKRIVTNGYDRAEGLGQNVALGLVSGYALD